MLICEDAMHEKKQEHVRLATYEGEQEPNKENSEVKIHLGGWGENDRCWNVALI